MMQFTNTGMLYSSFSNAPPAMKALFRVSVQLDNLVRPNSLKTAPPARSAALRLRRQFHSRGLAPFSLAMAPPSSARLSSKVQFRKTEI